MADDFYGGSPSNNPNLTPFGNSIGGGAGGNANWLTSMGGAGIAGAGLAYNLFKGDKTDPNITSLTGLASKEGAQGDALTAQGNTDINYLNTNTLPAGQQAGLDLTTNANRARLMSNAAGAGLSADPSKNSALTADLNANALQAEAQKAQMEMQLAKFGQELTAQGLQYAGMQSQTYQYLASYNQKQDAATGSAISSFASALGGFATKAAPLLLAA